MRIRHALATATLGATLSLGALALPAQAAQQEVDSVSAAPTSATVSPGGDERRVVGPAGWEYVDWYFTQASCRVHGQVRGVEWYDWYCGKSGALWYLYFRTS
jgi:hypothetical protein